MSEKQDEKRSESTVPNHLHEEALKAREEFAEGDPFEDKDNIRRSFPNAVDESGTPDTQPHEPKEALGEGQLSIDSIKAENEEIEERGEVKRGGKPGLAKVSKEDQEAADRKARPNAPENK